MTDRYDAAELTAFAASLLQRAGLEADKARTTAAILVEADLLGHATHGLAQLKDYLEEVETGRWSGTGEPAILSSGDVVEVWDGGYLPGPWLVARAADLASARARASGLAAVAIRRSAHIGCLAAYLKPIADRGQMIIIASSDPSSSDVAPFGGLRPLYSPNPIAAGWPTPGGTALIDVSMSLATNAMVGRLRREGREFEHATLLDNQGRASRDPAVIATTPPGSLLPLGGMEAGHKGFALGLLVEALTAALAGHGRAEQPSDWGASVFVLVLDPARFAGLDAFLRQTGWLADAVHATPPLPGGEAMRLPGERGLALRAEQLAQGVLLHPSIPSVLESLAAKFGMTMPRSESRTRA
jgi:L-lactate dehydrogenase